MTVNPPNQKLRLPARWLGAEVCVKAVAVAENEKVKTVLVDVGDILIPMKGPSFPHVTIAVNPAEGGKPFMSNQFSLNDFQSISPIILCGVIEEVQ